MDKKTKISEISKSIDDLLREIDERKNLLSQAISEAIYETAEDNPTKLTRISEHIVTIKASDMLDNPWSLSFYDWRQSAKVVIDYLKNRPVTDWKRVLEEKLNKKSGPILFEKRGSFPDVRASFSTSTPISRVFIQKIVDKL